MLRLIVLLITVNFAVPLQAKEVTQQLKSSGLIGEANYVKGDVDKPAVLIIHGFLTTKRFHTVKTMGDGLQDEGYSTLTPTMTLGINNRKESLKCNSIHSHTLEKDIEEIEDWVNWLKAKGHTKIVLLGHSSGSQVALSYLTNKAHSGVIGSIFTSLFYLNGKELGTQESDIVLAQKMIDSKQKRPNRYSLLFCKNNYYALPESFLSYMTLDRKTILSRLNAVNIPNFTIMGGEDKRYQSVGRDWLTELEKTNTQLSMIEGANHFFSSDHEFDLQDVLNESMANILKAEK